MMKAVYPGTFDPMTRGHEDLVRRASKLFDRLIVGVADSRSKKPFFSMQERVEIATEVLGHYPNVEVAGFTGLLKDFVRAHEAKVIIRGLRAVSDFEYEFQMAGMNRSLYPTLKHSFSRHPINTSSSRERLCARSHSWVAMSVNLYFPRSRSGWSSG